MPPPMPRPETFQALVDAFYALKASAEARIEAKRQARINAREQAGSLLWLTGRSRTRPVR